MKKQCTKCKEIKDIINFVKDKRRKFEIGSNCRICHSEINKKWQKKNKEKINKQRIEYRKLNKEKCLKREREWKRKNRGKFIKWSKNWRTKNPKKVQDYGRQYRDINKEKIKKYHKEYCKNWLREKLKKDPKARLNSRIATAIYQVLKNNKAGRKWETLVGYTLQDLTHHLEKQFNDKMNWQNYGSYWHIDHIVPKSWFPYQTAEEQAFRNCWALANLQPLEAKANLIKSNKNDSVMDAIEKEIIS